MSIGQVGNNLQASYIITDLDCCLVLGVDVLLVFAGYHYVDRGELDLEPL